MDSCDVLIGGGGPAGSTCAWKLRQAGLDVLVLDRARFPRDKPCAGWVTPQAIQDLALDVEEYRRGRIFQAITGFRIGLIGAEDDVAVPYDRAVSFGVRRCEFDHYLLFRTGARLRLGTPITRIRRDGSDWIVNDTIRTPMLVGAGGHFCAVSAWLNGHQRHDRVTPLVLAQETEFPVEQREPFPTAAETPEFYFADDFGGYGWLCRKQQYMNVGYGHRVDGGHLKAEIAEFVGWLERRGRVPSGRRWPWRGHAYLLRDGSVRRVYDEGVVLVGDAAGLAYPQSGEGIRPAIESGLFAAAAILEAGHRYAADDLAPYEASLRTRLAPPRLSKAFSNLVPHAAAHSIGRALVGVPWFVRTFVLDRWFLHADQLPVVT